MRVRIETQTDGGCTFGGATVGAWEVVISVEGHVVDITGVQYTLLYDIVKEPVRGNMPCEISTVQSSAALATWRTRPRRCSSPLLE